MHDSANTALLCITLALVFANLAWNFLRDMAEDAVVDDPWGEDADPTNRDIIHYRLDGLMEAATAANNIEAMWFIDNLRHELLQCPLPEHEITPLTSQGGIPVTAEAACDICSCGDPSSEGTVHRMDGPCYVDDVFPAHRYDESHAS